jgi:hypothetical protein
VELDPLVDAIESLEDGLLLYDADDRLVLARSTRSSRGG